MTHSPFRLYEELEGGYTVEEIQPIKTEAFNFRPIISTQTPTSITVDWVSDDIFTVFIFGYKIINADIGKMKFSQKSNSIDLVNLVPNSTYEIEITGILPSKHRVTVDAIEVQTPPEYISLYAVSITDTSIVLEYNSTYADGVDINMALNSNERPKIIPEHRRRRIEIINLLPETKYDFTLLPKYNGKQGEPVFASFWTNRKKVETTQETTSTTTTTLATTIELNEEIIDNRPVEDEILVIEDNLNEDEVLITSDPDIPIRSEEEVINEINENLSGVADDTEVDVINKIVKTTQRPSEDIIELVVTAESSSSESENNDEALSIEFLNELDFDLICSSNFQNAASAKTYQRLLLICKAFNELTTQIPKIDPNRKIRSPPTIIQGAPLPGQSQGIDYHFIFYIFNVAFSFEWNTS